MSSFVGVPDPIWVELLRYATTAPSGDNCQPWRFRFEGPDLVVGFDPAADRSIMNTDDVGTLMAIGAFAETFDIAAAHLGYTSTWSWVLPARGPLDPACVARVTLAPAASVDHPLFDAITRRHTDRNPFGRAPLAIPDRHRLESCLGADADVRLALVIDSAAKKSLASILALNDQLVFAEHHVSDRLFATLHWGRLADDQPVGMSVRTLAQPRHKEILLSLMRSRLVRRVAPFTGAPLVAAADARQRIRSSAAIAMLVAPGDTHADLVAVGRAMQRLWLTAEAMGLAVQPIVGLPMLIRHVRSNAVLGLRASTVRAVVAADGPLREHFDIAPDRLAAAAFRIGRSSTTVARTRRLPVASLVTLPPG
ncbi:MAG: hypothetical protein AB7L13_02705 [Acidimicrobiia bacterium]